MTQQEHVEHLYAALEYLRAADAQLTDPIYMNDMHIKQQIEDTITDLKKDIKQSEERMRVHTKTFSTGYWNIPAQPKKSEPKPESLPDEVLVPQPSSGEICILT